MNDAHLRLLKPPRLLLGGAVLFWGAFTDHALTALAMALLIEGRHWLDWRWRFGATGYNRAWVLSLLGIAGLLTMLWLNAGGIVGLLGFIEWLPVLFLPLILAQQYGEEEAIPATVFSAVARHRVKKAERLGKPVDIPMVHLGLPYFAFTILASGYNTFGQRERLFYFAGLLILVACACYFVTRQNARRPLFFTLAFIFVSLFSAAISTGLVATYTWISKGGIYNTRSQNQSLLRTTNIGKIKEIKQSRRLYWRMWSPRSQPHLVMTGSYNLYFKTRWESRDSEGFEGFDIFDALSVSNEPKNEGEFALDATLFDLNETASSALRFRGAIKDNRKEIPLSEYVGLISDAQEVDDIEISRLGTAAAVNADSVIDYRVWDTLQTPIRAESPRQSISRQGELSSYSQPPELRIPDDDEQIAFAQLSRRLGLHTMSDRDKIRAVYDYFRDFRYTKNLTIRAQAPSTPLLKFTTEVKAGHCEYFASATALLLRAAGIPTRYATGFSAREKASGGEFLLRGTHGHAWCLAYINGQPEVVQSTFTNDTGETKTIDRIVWTGGEWIEVDTTPASWSQIDSPDPTWQEKWADWWQRLREDFQIWRSSESNRGWVNLVLLIIGGLLLAFIAFRLAGTRLRKTHPHTPQSLYGHDQEPSPFVSLMPRLESLLGPRPPGIALRTWLKAPEFTEEQQPILHETLALHESYRFNQDRHVTEQLTQLVERLKQTLPPK
ncbi:MAG: transglutaminase domain-containing protein [Verrucomicrobiota bacterium]